jgi:lipid-binding SYLF domain-containing protein
MMKTSMKRIGVCLLSAGIFLMLLIVGTYQAVADDKTEAQTIVEKSRLTLNSFMNNQDYRWLQENLKNAKGILIYPQLLKAGFIFGGSGGTGVLLVADEKTGNWSQPAFYTVGSVSFGLQIGGEAAETVILVMSSKAVDSLYTSSVKMGGDTSFAMGPVGAGAKSNVMADFVAFSMSEGAYAGLNLEGSVVGVRDSLNEAYYGKPVRPVQIIVEKQVSNKGSEPLRTDLKKSAK